MPDDKSIDRSELLALTAEIVAAHVGNNAVAGADVAALIQSVFDTLGGLAADEPVAAAEQTPAVPIRRSVTDDHIVCLEDGKKLKMLKRHLMSDHGMTPEAYRAKWGLSPTTRWWRRTTRRSARRSRSSSAWAASPPRRTGTEAEGAAQDRHLDMLLSRRYDRPHTLRARPSAPAGRWWCRARSEAPSRR